MNSGSFLTQTDIFARCETFMVNDLETGLAKAKEFQHLHAQCVRIALADGVHRISQPVVIRGNEYPHGLILTAQPDAAPILDGSTLLDAERFEKQGAYYLYRFQPDENGNFPQLHDFYDNGKRIPVCRSASTVLGDSFPDRENRENPQNLLGFYLDEEYLKTIGYFDDGHAAEAVVDVILEKAGL